MRNQEKQWMKKRVFEEVRVRGASTEYKTQRNGGRACHGGEDKDGKVQNIFPLFL